MTTSYCSHPSAAPGVCGKVIASHTIQRRGGLSAIAEDGHVLSVRAGTSKVVENDGLVVPQLVGCRSASTFAGFCGDHDREMFAPIETIDPPLTKESIFLFSFRAIAYEEFAKRAALQTTAVARQMDKGRSFEFQAAIQEMLYLQREGMERGLNDIIGWKEAYHRAFTEQRFDSFFGYACAFDSILPAASCGAFHPETSFAGQPLQIITRGEGPFEHVAVSLSPVRNRTILTIGWFAAPNGPATQFTQSFRDIPADEKANAALHLAFEHLENTFIRPSWWENLSLEARACLDARIMCGLGLGGPARAIAALSNRVPRLSSARALEEVFLEGA